jgi:dihydrofolate reductase
MKSKVTAILATNDDFLVGHGNGLPWKCSPDLIRFKELTSNGDWVVMGYNTYKGFCETWPSKTILPGRKVCVLFNGERTSFNQVTHLHTLYGKNIDRVVAFNISQYKINPLTVNTFLISPLVWMVKEWVRDSQNINVNIIGGANTFELFAPIITDIELTRIITPEGYTPPTPIDNPIYLGQNMLMGDPQLKQVFEDIKNKTLPPLSVDEDKKTGVKCEFYHIVVKSV